MHDIRCELWMVSREEQIGDEGSGQNKGPHEGQWPQAVLTRPKTGITALAIHYCAPTIIRDVRAFRNGYQTLQDLFRGLPKSILTFFSRPID